MSKVIYNTATSFNGYIADENNSLSWLFEIEDPNPEDDGPKRPDHDLFLSDIGVLVSGSTTYEWVLNEEDLLAHPEKWPEYYGDRPYFVFTTRELKAPQGCDVRFSSGGVADVFDELVQAANGKDIWVIGGGDLVGQFFDAGLLDQIQLSVAPVALSGGAPVLPRTITSKNLVLESNTQYGPFTHLIYNVKKS